MSDVPISACKIRMVREQLESATVQALIRDLNAELTKQYPEEGANHFRLDPDEVAEGRGALLVAYLDDAPVGCGAVRRIEADAGELKRMYVVPSARGRGIGRLILNALESEARKLGVRRLVLETGSRQREAMALYSRAGFQHIPSFGEYASSPLSVCMSKELE